LFIKKEALTLLYFCEGKLKRKIGKSVEKGAKKKNERSRAKRDITVTDGHGIIELRREKKRKVVKMKLKNE